MTKSIEVTKENPCAHCGKPDYCYRIEPLSVCSRDHPPTDGWYKTSKTDQEGHYYYAPINRKKSPRPKQKRVWEYPDREGNPYVRVIRIDDGKGCKPKRWQESWDGQKWVKGLKGIKRENIPIYKYKEIKEALSEAAPSATARSETIFVVEGEPCADALWKLGLPATTNIGGSSKWKPSDSKDLEGAKVVLCPDRDQPGVAHMEAIATDFPDAKWLYAYPNSPFWNNLPPNQGLDVADWICDCPLTSADIWEAIEPKRVGLPNPEIPTSAPAIEENYTQKCQAALYSDKRWLSLNGKLCFWTGTYYQESPKEVEIQRITKWCSTTPVPVGKNKWKYTYATATYVDNIWNWLQRKFSYPPSKVNPPGINCLNGVVKIKWDGKRATWERVDHDPDVVYTYISEIKFAQDADPTDCDRMLSCLSPREQKLFIQTIAASLDLATIRSFQGREASRALLCKGHGSNGKDTLREAVRILFGQSMSNATVSDFAAYDLGRKFCLSKLFGSLINWSSENSSFNNLDRLESLKAAITGDPLDMERKGVDERLMMLNAIFLFNVNEVPNLQAGMEAIQSRWAVLSFNKTYKKNADPSKGEIEADSRFRYDPNFLKEKVCPALLNKILEAISTLAATGIDYSCTTDALQNIQRETNHLWAFAQDVGLDYKTNGHIYINDLWELLQSWYINNGTLEIVESDNGKKKKIWHDQPRRGDKNVKAPNQIYQRFAELFPKIKRIKNNDVREGLERKGKFYLSDIAITRDAVGEAESLAVSQGDAVGEAESLAVSQGDAMETQWRRNGDAVGDAVSLAVSQGDARDAISPKWAEILDKTKKLSSEQKKQLASVLLSDKGLASFIIEKLSSENSIIHKFTAKNPSEVDKTESLASPLDVERVTASSTASPLDVERVTASPTDSPASAEELTSDSTQTQAPLNREIPQDLAWENSYSLIEPDCAKYSHQLEAIKNAPLLSLDIETYGENKREGLHPRRGNIRLIQLGLPDTTYICDLGGRLEDRKQRKQDLAEFFEVLRETIQNQEQLIVGHNLLFDLRFLATQYGIRQAQKVACTLLGLQVYFGDAPSNSSTGKKKHEAIFKGGYGLANAVEKLLGVQLDKTYQTSDFGQPLTAEQLSYAASDAYWALSLYEKLEEIYANKSSQLYSPKVREIWSLENQVIAPTIEVELAGLPLDTEELERQKTRLLDISSSLEAEWQQLVPGIKYTQRDKLLQHLNEQYELNLNSLTKADLAPHKNNPVVTARRKLEAIAVKLNQLEAFERSAKRDGRVHTIYRTLTGFGRFSSGGGNCAARVDNDLPNLQSIGAKSDPILSEYDLSSVRKCIRPEPGKVMAVIDLAGAHGRIAADQAADPVAIAGNNDPSVDNHSKVAAYIASSQGFDWDWQYIKTAKEDKTHPDHKRAKSFRDTAKNTYYGWLNGAGADRIQEQIAANTGQKPSLSDCIAAIEGCKELYPKVVEFRKALMKELKQSSVTVFGQPISVNAISDGSRICLPLEPSRYHPDKLEPAYTQNLACIWSRIEATAMKNAFIQVCAKAQLHPEWELKVINVVHDELDLEVNSRYATDAITAANNIVGDCFKAQLKYVDDGRSTDWKKLKVKSWADK